MGEQVTRAIRRGIAHLRSKQQLDGEWPRLGPPGGMTALCVVAMLNAGVPKDDPAVRRALQAIAQQTNQYTYVVTLKIMALSLADPKAYAAQIQRAADWLSATQLDNGAWTYHRRRGGAGDHSNTQFALLGLHAASQVEARISPRMWRAAEQHWSNTQLSDGGWAYQTSGKGRATGSMTAAGVASLYIVGNSLTTRREHGFKDGRAPNCGRYAQNTKVAAGLAWLTRHFTVQTNPGSGGHLYYYLYALERVGMLTGLSRLGDRDWYRQGAAMLVATQGADGSWGRSPSDTPFALMFLGKGYRSILVNKLRWSRTHDWQEDRNDAAHLTGWLGTKLGQPVTWQVVDLSDPMARWLEAPILYFNGHRFPKFTAEQSRKLRRFVEMGGTILAEACCGMKAFTTGMRIFAAEHFGEWPLRPLDAEHPVYRALYKLDAKDFAMEGIDLGCRTSILFSPRDLSCLWEQGNIPKLSERAFRMGANIAAYATGREPLPDRLATVEVPEERRGRVNKVRSGLQIGQVVHNGGWRPAPYALPNLAGHLSARASVDVVTKAEPIRLDQPSLFEHPIIYMAGQHDFALKPEERTALKRYLERGGFLFADACCGRGAFDKAFRRLMSDLFGSDALDPLPKTHPILSGQIGYDISHVTYQPIVRQERPDLTRPELYGVEVNGRTAVVYSPYDIGCALEAHKGYHCRGYVTADAQRVGVNIVLYALSY